MIKIISIFLFASLLNPSLFSQNTYHQLDMIGDATNNSPLSRQFINLDNTNDSDYSLVALKLSSGTNANNSFGVLGTAAYSYTHTPGHAGYTYLFSTNNGLIFRADNPMGNIKFVTGGLELINERMRITETGNVGISTSAPASKLQVANGDIYIEDINYGIIMKSPDGNCWRGTLDNSGNLSFSSISCP